MTNNSPKKKVQMSQEFLEGVQTLLEALQGHPMDKPMQNLTKTLRNELEAKYEALERRQAFTEYKQASTDNKPDREHKRQAYLDQADVHKDWRSQKEIPYSP